MNGLTRDTLLLFDRFLYFALVGLCGTATQYVALWVGVELVGGRASVSSGIGYLMGALVNYFLNHFFTFGNDHADRSHLVTMSRYYVLVGVGWCINTALMALLVDRLMYSTWAMQILVTGVCLVWNYLLARLWVFGGSK